MKVLRRFSTRVLLFGLLGVFAAGMSMPASAQTSQVPDFTQFGFPNVMGTTDFTPGTAATVTAGNQRVMLPADFMSKPVKFELLEGDTSTFTQGIESDDMVVATFAFRVTDAVTDQLIGKFDKPVMWSITDPAVSADSEIYNTSAANPPNATSNPTPGTFAGGTFSHAFGGAGVGWLVISPAVVVGMPTTGNNTMGVMPLALLAGAVVLAGGIVMRRRERRGAAENV